jgi:SAM-dependent methyltransferase
VTVVDEWDQPATAQSYEAFCERHPRYRAANRALAAHAALRPGQLVLDVAAGTGRTAEALLPTLGRSGRIVCFEPARAMREAGMRRLPDSRVTWRAEWPDQTGFDRITCGAAIWQLAPLGEAFARLASGLAPGGAVCFNIPALYLGIPDAPGAGRDPSLHELAARVVAGRTPAARPSDPLPGPDGVESLLAAVGLAPTPWSFRTRLTQAAYRDWLKVPPTTSGWLSDLSPDERAGRIDHAYEVVDPGSWRWERWLGWTAWKR